MPRDGPEILQCSLPTPHSHTKSSDLTRGSRTSKLLWQPPGKRAHETTSPVLDDLASDAAPPEPTASMGNANRTSMLGLTSAGGFQSVRRTKLYDLLAALTLIAWLAFAERESSQCWFRQMMLCRGGSKSLAPATA